MAEVVLSAIPTVFAFGGENVEVERYSKELISSQQVVKIKGLLLALGDGFLRLISFVSCAVGFWFGVQFVLNDRNKAEKEYTPASLLTVRYVDLTNL